MSIVVGSAITHNRVLYYMVVVLRVITGGVRLLLTSLWVVVLLRLRPVGPIIVVLLPMVIAAAARHRQTLRVLQTEAMTKCTCAYISIADGEEETISNIVNTS